MNLYAILFYFAQINSLLLIIAILSRKEIRQANLFLCGMIVSALSAQWVRFLMITGEIHRASYLLRWPFATSLLVPALFYLYALALTTPDFKWQRKYLLHFIPFGFGLLWNGAFLLSGRPEFWIGTNPLSFLNDRIKDF